MVKLIKYDLKNIYTGDAMVLNILTLVMAGLYWYVTGHSVPMYLGLALIVTLYNDELYFTSLVIAAVTIVAIIFYFWSDYFSYKAGEEVLHTGTGAIYILVLFAKARVVFNAGKSIIG